MRNVIDAGPRTVRAIGLMAQIRYQVAAPTTATLGPCPGCSAGSRDGLRCASCIDRELAELTGVATPTDYLRACRVQRAAESHVLATTDCLDAQQPASKRQPECREEICP